MAWVILAIIQLVCAVLIGGLIIIKDKPEDMEKAPDGIYAAYANSLEKEPSHNSQVFQSSMDLKARQVMRKPITWLIITMAASNLFALDTMNAHQVAYLEDVGFSPIVASMTLGLASVKRWSRIWSLSTNLIDLGCWAGQYFWGLRVSR